MYNYTRVIAAALTCVVAPLMLHARPNVGQAPRQAKQLSFTENKGQVTDQQHNKRTDIDYKLSPGNGLNIFIGDGVIHYQWSRNRSEMKIPENLPPHEVRKLTQDYLQTPATIDMYRMDVTLVGANKNATVINDEQQTYYERFYNSSLGEDGVLAHTFNKITYQNIYPNIDWVLYSSNNELKYDFVVHPGGNASDIKLKYGGATTLKLEKGEIIATTPHGNIAEEKPYTYDANTKQSIVSSFVLNGDVLSFNVAPHEGTVVIDPQINWGTYYGGTDYEYGYGVGADNSGNSFLAGWTNSTNNIATTGAYQTTLNTTSAQDGFVVKFNAAGVRQWGTYYGDAGTDYFWSATCDPSGNAYVSGYTTSSSGVTSTGAYQTSNGGNSDALLVKFSTTGARLWATYYGGSNGESYGNAACDQSGNVFLSGHTFSSNNISTTGSHQPNINNSTSGSDAFLVKFNSNGVRQWGTYYGGPGTENGWGIACDPSGNVFLSGWTTSTTDIATTGGHQSSHAGSNTYDGFVVKFNGSGVRQWGTYYGGSDYDVVYDVSADNLGNVYAVGYTYSSSGIATTGAYQATLNTTNIYDGYIVKFNPAGVRQWGSYYGSTGSDYLWGVATTTGGYVYTSGWTNSTSGIATTNGYQTTFGGVQDLFLVEWDNTATPSWATYYGGSQQEWGYGNCTWSSAGYVFISGMTWSTSGIATTNGHQTTHGNATTSQYDAFMVSFTTDTIVYIKQPFIDTVFCPGDTFKLPYGVTYNFRNGNVFTAQLSNAAGNFAIPVTIGTKVSSQADTIICVIPQNTPTGTGYRIRIVGTQPFRISDNNGKNILVKPGPVNFNASANTPLCEGQTLTLTATSGVPTTVYNWTGPLSFSSTNAVNTIPSVTTAHAGDYVVTANAGNCTTFDTVKVVVNTIPAVPTVTIDSPICYHATLGMMASSTTTGVAYNWTGPSGFTSTQVNPAITFATPANSGTYYVTATKLGCTSAAGSATTLVYPKTPLPDVPDSAIQCVGSTLNIAPVNIPGATYAWRGPGGFTATTQNLIIPLAQLFHSGNYIVQAELHGCLSDVDTVYAQINIKAKIGGYASPNDTVCTGTFMTYVAMQNNGGPSPVYQWYKNYQPIAGANSLLYSSSNVASGDKFHCTMYSVGVCDLPVTVSTDTIEMVVLPIVTSPSVTITSNPAVPQPNELTVFTAKVQNGGPLPKYQWQVNGKDQVGATYATWSAATLRPFDKVDVVITSNDPCANVKTATSDTMMVGFPTGIANLKTEEALSLYPNPNKGSFTIKGSTDMNNEAGIEVLNAVGQIVYRSTVQPVNGSLDAQITLPGSIANGVYLLRITGGDQTKHVRFTLDR